jgi:glycosyltransferase involved in cell wall biosynthesis
MKILMLDNEFPPLGGGMGTANRAVLKYIAAHSEIRIDLITSALGGQTETTQFSKNITIYKVPVWNKNIHHSSNRELIFYAVQALYTSFRLHRKNSYDFCFAWSALPAGAVAYALNKGLKLPYMVWISGPDTPGFEQRYQRIYPILTPLLRKIWKGATPLIAKCTEEVDLIHAVEDDLPVEIIPNGVDTDGFQPGDPVPDDGPLKIVCSARLIERKGQHHLIKAVKQLCDEDSAIQVDFLGDGDSLSNYQKLSQRLGVERYVNFLGYVPRERIARYYAEAHVFVLPSFYEGMSLAALEAMASGLPVILTRTGGTDELVQDGVNGFTFEWGDVESLAAHLKHLHQNRALARQMGAASRHRADKFSWNVVSKRFLDVFANEDNHL